MKSIRVDDERDEVRTSFSFRNPLYQNEACTNQKSQLKNGEKPYNNQVWRMINFYRWSQLMELS